MTKSSLLFLFVICFLAHSFGQEKWKLIKEIKQEANFISTDRLGNLYVINDNSISMYNKNGDSLRSFNSQRFGTVAHLDCTDPYQLLVFFEDYNMVLFLDNFLSENGDIVDLQQLDLDQVSLACHSREAGFWAFDQIRQRVLHLNDNFEITHQTVNFVQWFGHRLEPNYMVEYNNKLYLNVPESGIFVFDHFGTYLKTIALKNIKNPQFLEGRINYLNKEQSFCHYNIQNFSEECEELKSFGSLKQVRIEKGRTYLFDGLNSKIFKLN